MAKAWHDVMEMCRKVFTSKMNSNLDKQHDFPILRVSREHLQSCKRYGLIEVEGCNIRVRSLGHSVLQYAAPVCSGFDLFADGVVGCSSWFGPFGRLGFVCFIVFHVGSTAVMLLKPTSALLAGSLTYRNLLVWPPIMAIRCQRLSAWGHAG